MVPLDHLVHELQVPKVEFFTFSTFLHTCRLTCFTLKSQLSVRVSKQFYEKKIRCARPTQKRFQGHCDLHQRIEQELPCLVNVTLHDFVNLFFRDNRNCVNNNDLENSDPQFPFGTKTIMLQQQERVSFELEMNQKWTSFLFPYSVLYIYLKSIQLQFLSRFRLREIFCSQFDEFAVVIWKPSNFPNFTLLLETVS